MRIVTPAFFCFPFAWNIFFHPLTSSLYVFLGLKWVSCRQHIYRSCFCIYSASLCLLVGAFNPFTFKVIIDIYVPIVIFLVVWGWFCRSCSSLVFPDYISPFNICCKAGFVVLNSVNFYLSEMLLISPSILNEILAGYSNLGCRFSPFLPAIPFWPAEFLLKDQLLSIWGFTCMLPVAFPLLLLIFFLCVQFMLVWLACVLACFSLGLSCMGLFAPLGLDWPFPFPCWRNFQL